MLFFRSEEELQKWLDSSQAERGELFSIPQLWEFSQCWYRDRMSPEYHGRMMEQVQEIFQEFGLTARFWQVG
ncbi:MAG TPA: hypothetical protein VJ785_15115 [Anaerolineales bacterium]|nr:hypothetical protein [Anaerolineales bacterium]